MTETTAETETALLDTFVEASVPFADAEEPSKEYEVKEPLGDIVALQDKISEAVGQDVSIIVSYPHGLDVEVDDEHPAVVYVKAAEDFDGRKVRGVLISHSNDTAEEQTARQALTDQFDGLKASLLDGADLDLEQVNIVLRHILS